MASMRSREELWSSQRTQFCQCMRARGVRLTMGVGRRITATMTTMMMLAMTLAMRRRSIIHLNLNTTHHLHLPLPDMTTHQYTTGSSSLSPRLRLQTMDTIIMRTEDMRIMGLGVRRCLAIPSMTHLTLMTDRMPFLLMP